MSKKFYTLALGAVCAFSTTVSADTRTCTTAIDACKTRASDINANNMASKFNDGQFGMDARSHLCNDFYGGSSDSIAVCNDQWQPFATAKKIPETFCEDFVTKTYKTNGGCQ